MIHPNGVYTSNIETLINHLSSFSKNPNNVQFEVIYRSLKNQNDNFPESKIFPIPIAIELEWRRKYAILTVREREILSLILKNYKQQQICLKLNIKLNTQKKYRKILHQKIGISDFSQLTDIEREIIFRFANKK